MTQPTQAQVARALNEAGHERAKWRKQRVSSYYSPGYRIEVYQGEPHAVVYREVGYISVAGPRDGQSHEGQRAKLGEYAEALRAAGLNVQHDGAGGPAGRLLVTR